MNLKFINIFSFIFLFTLSTSFSQSKENDSLKIVSLLESIKDFGNENNFIKYNNIVDSVIDLSGNNKKLLIKSLLLKSKLHWSLSKFDLALITSNKALQVAKKNKFKIQEAEVYQNFAYIYQRKGESKNAIDFALKALNLFEQSNNQDPIADTYVLLGVLKASLGNTDDGIVYFEKALIIHQITKKQG